MAKPSTRQGLVDYALRQNGAPVLEINIEDDQLDDLMDDAIQFYNERNSDGYIRTHVKIKWSEAMRENMVTDTTTTIASGTSNALAVDYSEQNNYVKMPEYVTSVIKVFPFVSKNVTNLFDVRYQWRLNDLWDLTNTEILTYEMVNRRLEDIYFLLEGQKQTRFQHRGNKLYLDLDWKTDVNTNDFLVLECYRAIDPTADTAVYNDLWMKRYMTALVKRQWGANLIKFKGAQLPGGITMNGEFIYNEGKAAVEKLEEEMLTVYETMPLDMIG
jgi:Asp-tRNA(Asn)/Glu-tRNA(Gln) amidotransferase A subunit family amidase